MTAASGKSAPGSSAEPETIADVIAKMEAIKAALPASDGVACFNDMYLQVTRDVDQRVTQGFFADPAYLTKLDVLFANLYFAAADAAASGAAVPPAWQPLIASRSTPDIEPIQFALAGMNAHINHDLPLAMVATSTAIGSAPTDGQHHADYQKVDALLDAAEQSIRESFEKGAARAADRHAANVINLLCNWSITAARDVAWNNAVALWAIRDVAVARDLLEASLARTVAMASRVLLTPV